MMINRTRILKIALFGFFILIQQPDVLIHAQEINTIERTHDVLVIKGKEFPFFRESQLGVDQIRVYRYLYATGQWEPIPFQVDEMDLDSTYFGQKNTLLDDNDEIVFMAKDLGDSVPATEWVDDEEARNSVRYQISADDPLSPGKKGWVYVYCSSTLDMSENTYIQYSPGEDKVESAYYEIVHWESGLQEILHLKPSAGGDGIDFLDRQKFRLTVSLDLGALGSPEIVIKEEMRNEEVEIFPGISAHVNVGKKRVESCSGSVVRLLRRMILNVKAEASFLGYQIAFEDSFGFNTTYYSTYSEWKTGGMEIPEIAEGDVREIRLSVDLNANAHGMQFFSKYNPGINGQGNQINGFPWNLQSYQLDWPGQNWHLFVADPSYGASAVLQNASIVTLIELKGDPPGDRRLLYFKDDASEDENDTGDKMSYGDVGIKVLGNSISGFIDFYSASYYIPANLDTAQAGDIYQKHFNPLIVEKGEERLKYTLSVEVSPPGAGDIVVEPPGDVAYADSIVVLTAVPNPRYAFDHWSDNIDILDTNGSISFVMDGPKSITANFLPLRDITIETDPSGLRFTVDSVEYTSGQTFTWVEGSTHPIGVDSLQNGSEGIRFHFASWSDGGNRLHDYFVPAQDEHVVAQYTTQYFLTTAENPEDAGDVVPVPPGAWYNDGTYASLFATPVGFYAFMSWSGDLTSSQSPDSVLMDKPKTITAHFGNYAPELSIPDTSFAEDDTLDISFQWILQWVEDDNNHDSTLVIGITGGDRLNATIDTDEERIQIFSKVVHWNGVDTVHVTVTDPLNASGQDAIVITVMPVPDPPEGFSLLSPSDGYTVTDWPSTLDFSWEPSYDPDEEDIATYVFKLDTTSRFDSGRLVQVDSLNATEYSFPWPEHYGDGIYYWRIEAVDGHWPPTLSDQHFTLTLATGIEGDRSADVPTSFILDQNFPNPFNSETTIRFGLPSSGHVLLVIYNSHGQQVRTLLDERMDKGYHIIHWDGMDNQGLDVASGLYFVLFKGDSFKFVKKAVLLR